MLLHSLDINMGYKQCLTNIFAYPIWFCKYTKKTQTFKTNQNQENTQLMKHEEGR